MTLSDAEIYTNCLENCRKSCKENEIKEIKIIPITWGLVSEELLGLSKVDIILGSDCFYDSKGNSVSRGFWFKGLLSWQIMYNFT